MDDKVKEVEPRCKHLVLDECSQEHHNNCVGLRQCILDMEQQNLALKEKLKVAVDTLSFYSDMKHFEDSINLDFGFKDKNQGIYFIEGYYPIETGYNARQALTKIGEVE